MHRFRVGPTSFAEVDATYLDGVCGADAYDAAKFLPAGTLELDALPGNGFDLRRWARTAWRSGSGRAFPVMAASKFSCSTGHSCCRDPWLQIRHRHSRQRFPAAGVLEVGICGSRLWVHSLCPEQW